MSSTDVPAVSAVSSHESVDSSPREKARVMEVTADPISPQASVADTVGNLTYIEGDVLDIQSAPWATMIGSLSQLLTTCIHPSRWHKLTD